ncbi:MAG: hypothetical protein LIP01_01265 [Tannerellaceae bacterium]|nr:hypothetical protein [Tannerellaceae bacterium]
MTLNKIKATTKGRDRKKIFLFSGLFFLASSGIVFLSGLSQTMGIVLMGAGICMKSLFLLQLFTAPDFKMSRELYLILTGVILILISLLFKYLYPLPLLRNILFYTAIILKVSGVCLLFFHKKPQ